MVRINHEIHPDQSWSERWQALARIYDERYGTELSKLKFASEGQAQAAYHQLRSRLYPYYSQWQHAVNQAVDQRLEAASVG